MSDSVAVSGFAWSPSRQATFNECRRKYYYQYYLSRGGWEDTAHPDSRLALRLKKLGSVDAFVGTLVHEEVGRFLMGLRDGKPILPEAGLVVDKLDQALDASASKVPEIADFSHDYYGSPLSTDKREECRAKANVCVSLFIGSSLFLRLTRRPEDFKLIWIEDPCSDELHCFSVGECRVAARLDFACELRGVTHICDFKTGKPSDNEKTQMGCYALFANKEWGCAADSLKCYAMHLHPVLSYVECPVTADFLLRTESQILSGYQEMTAVVDGEDNAREDDFSKNGRWCSWCNFRQLCGRLSNHEKTLAWLGQV